jgi:fibronectin-binding autotransporter adhesin
MRANSVLTFATFLTGVCMCVAALNVRAATFVWNGGAGDNNWSTVGNWIGNVAPANDGTAVIVLSGTNQLTPNVDVTWDINSLTFSNNAGPFVLGGNPLMIRGGGIVNSNANTQIVNNTITLRGNQTWNATAGALTFNGNVTVTNLLIVTGGSDSIINGVISGTGSLTKSGTGTLTLTATNSYGGLTTVSAGVLNVQNSAGLGTTVSGTVVSSGATLQLQGGINVVGETLSLNGIGFNAGGAFRSISGSNSWGGTITLAGGSTINADADTFYIGANILNSTFVATFTNNGTILLSGGLGGGAGGLTGGLTKTGTGTLVINGTNSYIGATTISSGVFQFGATGTFPSASAVTVNAGGTLDLNGLNETIGSLIGAGNINLGGGFLTVGTAAWTIFSGVVNGTGGLIKVGGGTLTLSGVNTYGGGTVINAGAISIAAATGLGNPNNALSFNGGTLTTSATLTTARAIFLGTGGGTADVLGGTTLSLSGTISGPGALTKIAGGTLALTGANTYLGGTTNSAGVISINSDAALGDSGSTVTLNNSTLSTIASFATARSISLNSGTSFLLINTGVSNTFSGIISGTAAVTKSGKGLLILTGNNTFTNTLSISAGTLRLGASERLADSALVNVSQSGAIFDLNSFTETIGGLAGSGKVTLGGGALIAGANNSGTTYSGVISGTGSFTKIGTGTMIVSSANIYSGITTVGAGTLQISASQCIASASPLVVSNSAIFDLNNFSETIASLAGGGNVTLGSGNLTVGNASSPVFSGNISGTGAFTKVGTGTQSFNGANIFSGVTTISAGNLQINGSSPNSAVIIASVATLSGSGTVGTASVNSSAVISPGTSAPGTLSSGTETWAGGGNYVWEISNTAGTKGVNWDWLNISGALNITANAGGKFNLKIVSLTAANAAGQVINFDNTVTYVWTIASAGGGISGFNSANFNIDASAFQNPLGAGSFTLSQSGNDLNLIFTTAALATIKNIQSGTLVSSGNGTNTVILGLAVNPTNAFLIFNTRHNSSVPGGSMIRGRLSSSNTLEFVRATTETSAMNIQWYVAEYSAGVKVQRGEINQTNTTINVPLSPVSSLNQAFVTWSKTPDSTETSFSDTDPVVGEITATTNLQFRVSTAPSSVPLISWQVVEFTHPASISVQKGSVTTMTGTNLSATAPLSAPVDPNGTFLLTGYRTSGSGNSIGARMLRAQLTSANTITFDRSISGAPDNITEIAWQAIQLKDGSLVQSGSVNFANGVAETNVVFGNGINTNRALAFASVQPAGGQNTGRSPSVGSVLGVGSATLAMASGSQTILDRNNTADQADIGWTVIALGPGSILALASGSSAISADTTGSTYTSLIGPTYTEIQNGNVGTGTIILKVPAGFIFDTNVTLPTVLITRVGGSGANSLNINGVASGTSVAMTSVNQSNLTFIVTSASSGGVTCSLTWQNIRVRPSSGTPLASGSFVDIGTAVIQGVATNLTGWGFVTEVVGTATKLAIVTAPSSGVTAGLDFPQQPVIQIQDQFGNLRTANSTNIITATSSGTDTNNVNGSMTVVGGVAAFSGMSYQVAQTNTITFSSSGLTSKTSGNITVSAGAASQVVVLTQPSTTATVGINFVQQPVVQVQDQFGNLRKADNSTAVTASIDQGSGNLSGTQIITAANGVVTFTNLSYPIAETITIDFTSGSLNQDTSTSTTVNPANQTITFGALTNQIYGAANFAVNASASSGLPVTFSIVSGPATVSGNVVSVTGAGTVTVRADQPGNATYASATSVDQPFTVAKAASSLAISTSANPAPTGSNVMFTVTVSSSVGTPTGAVQFLADGTTFGSPAVLSGGITSIGTSSLSHGSHAIAAQYAGDGNFFSSTNNLNPNQVVNSSPAAANATLQRALNSGVKVRTAALLTNDTDPDGDVLTLVSVGLTSASGGTIVTNGIWIYYEPPAGFTNADNFNYTIADSYGLQATGVVFVTILVDSAPSQNVDSIENLGNGSSRIHFSEIPGRTDTVQYATNLVAPNWQSLGSATASTSGRFNFTDSAPTNGPSRLYRSTNP